MSRVTLLIGAPGSGKTYLMRHLLSNDLRESKYAYGFIICPTAGIHDQYDWVDKQLIRHEYTDELMSKLIATAQKMQKEWFLVLDDCLGSVDWNSNQFTRFITQHRHLCCRVFIGVQHAPKISTVVRECAQDVYMFAPTTSRAEIAMYENFGSAFESKKAFHDTIRECTSQKYHFLHMKGTGGSVSENYEHSHAPETLKPIQLKGTKVP